MRLTVEAVVESDGLINILPDSEGTVEAYRKLREEYVFLTLKSYDKLDFARKSKTEEFSVGDIIRHEWAHKGVIFAYWEVIAIRSI